MCFCGNSVGKYGLISDANCNYHCPGNISQHCGGNTKNSVYNTSISLQVKTSTSTTKSSSTSNILESSKALNALPNYDDQNSTNTSVYIQLTYASIHSATHDQQISETSTFSVSQFFFAQPNLPVISQYSLNNILSNDNLNPVIQTELVQVLSTNGLSSESQAQLIETLSAKNLDSSTQTTVINTLFKANLNADSLSGVLNILSNIILSPINIQKIESLFLNSTNITTIEESLTILSHTLNNDLIQLGTNGISDVLEQNKNLNGCLQNCSNNGDCLSENNTFVCFCRRNYEGKNCENIYNPCLVNPCLNEGVCILLPDKINLNTLDFYCKCSDNYNGSRCEEKIDRCEKQTCSNNGYCVDENNNGTSCVCKQYFSGSNCEV